MGCGQSKPNEDATKGSDAGANQKGRQHNGQQSAKKKGQVQRQPIHEKGWKKRIRENMRNAAAGDDIEHLEKCMQHFRSNHLDDGGDFTDAQRRMDFLLMRKEIRDACMRNHPEVLDKAIQKVEASTYRNRLKPYLDRAYYLKQQQTDLDTYRHDVLNMDQATISEIRSYHHPPDGVHPTMIAVYMICGHPEEHLSDWTEVTSLMGKYGKESLLREVDQADTRQVSNRVALRARNYLGMYTLDEVRSVSSGAATFHMWASEKVGQNQRNDDEGETHGNNAQDKNKTQGKNTQPQAKQTQQSKSKQDKNTEANTQQANKAVTKAAKGNKVDPRDTNGKAIKSTKKG